jgi:hypothetical protein
MLSVANSLDQLITEGGFRFVVDKYNIPANVTEYH